MTDPGANVPQESNNAGWEKAVIEAGVIKLEIDWVPLFRGYLHNSKVSASSVDSRRNTS